jgi:hypothetical protein
MIASFTTVHHDLDARRENAPSFAPALLNFDATKRPSPVPVPLHFDGRRRGHPSSAPVPLDFNSRRETAPSSSPVALDFEARRDGPPPSWFPSITTPNGGMALFHLGIITFQFHQKNHIVTASSFAAPC